MGTSVSRGSALGQTVETAELTDSAVTTAKIATDAVTTAKISDGQVTGVKMVKTITAGTGVTDASDTTIHTHGTVANVFTLKRTFTISSCPQEEMPVRVTVTVYESSSVTGQAECRVDKNDVEVQTFVNTGTSQTQQTVDTTMSTGDVFKFYLKHTNDTGNVCRVNLLKISHDETLTASDNEASVVVQS